MLKMAVFVSGLILSVAAQAERKLNVECLSNIRSKAKSDTETTLAPKYGVPSGKAAELGKIAGKTFSVTLVDADKSSLHPQDMIQITVKDGFFETTSLSDAPPEGEIASIATDIKSLTTGEIVAVSCHVAVTH